MTQSSPQDSDSDCYQEESHFPPASQAVAQEDSELIKTLLISDCKIHHILTVIFFFKYSAAMKCFVEMSIN